MIRMLLVGYCYGIRHERRLCQEVALHLAYRWFCKLDLDDKVPHHSTFSVNRLGRFRESENLRHIVERVVAACMVAGLVKGEGFAVDASVMEANASRYHGKAPDELDWTDAKRQKRAVAEYLAGLEAETQGQEGDASGGGGSDGQPTAVPDRKPPKVISPSDPFRSSATPWSGSTKRCWVQNSAGWPLGADRSRQWRTGGNHDRTSPRCNRETSSAGAERRRQRSPDAVARRRARSDATIGFGQRAEPVENRAIAGSRSHS